jgi:uncharacterized protein YggE
MEFHTNEMGINFAIKVAVIGVLAIFALFLFAELMSTLQNMGSSTNPPTHTIVVSGTGTATAVPDTATISFAASATDSSVVTAQSKVTASIKKALEGVKAAGVASDDITTTSFNVSPHYAQSPCPPGALCPQIATASGTSGFDVSENVTVKVRDTTKVSTILDVLAKANVSNVSGPDFVVDNTQAVYAQARGQAIQKAQQDAQALAGQLGVHLARIVSFSDSTGGNTIQPMFKGAAMATDSAPAPVVPVGQNTYTDTVSITYEIR